MVIDTDSQRALLGKLDLLFVKQKHMHIYNSQFWKAHFEKNTASQFTFSGTEERELTEQEALAIGASMQQFQLGEQSDGTNLINRTLSYTNKTQDNDFLVSIKLFIKEEQKHAHLLGTFMNVNGIPEIKKHWIDDAFRFLRKRAGLELMLSVLLMAEIISLLYYRALAQATPSALLASICDHILHDEKHHFSFHSAYISRLRENDTRLVRIAKNFFLRFLLLGTIIVVWRDHHTVLRSSYANVWIFMHLSYASLEESICIINPKVSTELPLLRKKSTV